MAKYRVFIGRDAWVVYSTVVEADSKQHARRIASDRKHSTDDWEEEYTQEFDHTEVFGDLTEELDE